MEKKINCTKPGCGRKFASIEDLNKHITSKHRDGRKPEVRTRVPMLAVNLTEEEEDG